MSVPTWLGPMFRNVVTALIVLGVVVVLFGGQSRREAELQDELVRLQELTLNATLAEACELALGVGPEGRDPNAVAECFTQYGLDPPRIVEEG